MSTTNRVIARCPGHMAVGCPHGYSRTRYYFAVQRREIEESKRKAGSGFVKYEEAPRRAAGTEEQLAEIRQAMAQLQAEAVDTIIGCDEATELERGLQPAAIYSTSWPKLSLARIFVQDLRAASKPPHFLEPLGGGAAFFGYLGDGVLIL